MKDFGCFVVSLSILLGQEPRVTLEALNRNNAFTDQGLLLSDVAAKTLGLKYKGKTKVQPKETSIAETDHYAPAYKSHFFVWDTNGLIIDPLDGKSKPNPYRIVSYRLFTPKAVKNAPEAKSVANKAIVPVSIERQITLWEKIIAGIYRVFKQGA